MDRTLLVNTASVAFGRYLYKRSFISFKDAALLLANYFLFLFGALSLDSLHHRSFKILFAQKCCKEFENLASEFVTEQIPQFINQPVADCLKASLQKGELVMVLSSSPDFLVKKIGAYFNVQHSHGTEYEIDENGRWVQISKIIDGHAKAEKVKEETQRRGIDLCDVSFYTDSIRDLPLLEIVGRPVLIKKRCKYSFVQVK